MKDISRYLCYSEIRLDLDSGLIVTRSSELLTSDLTSSNPFCHCVTSVIGSLCAAFCLLQCDAIVSFGG